MHSRVTTGQGFWLIGSDSCCRTLNPQVILGYYTDESESPASVRTLIVRPSRQIVAKTSSHWEAFGGKLNEMQEAQ